MKKTLLPLLLMSVLLSLSASQAQCPISVDLGPDIYACVPPSPATIQLNGTITGTPIDFNWYPFGSAVLNPTVKATAPINTYSLQARAVNESINLIVNGDFEQGNTGFTSGLTYSPGDLTPPDTYDILTNPQSANPSYAACVDHTTGTGNMMAVHPNTKGVTAWCQTVAVEPNTSYWFSYHVEKIFGGSPTNKVWVTVDGAEILASGTGGVCGWLKVAGLFTTSSQTSIEVCINAKNNSPLPNKQLWPFALDDIKMSPVCIVKDSVKVYVKSITTAPSANYTVPCVGSPITINATNGTTIGDFISYEWSTPNGNFVSGTNTLTPVIDQVGSYWLDLKFQSTTHTCTTKTGFVVNEGPELLTSILAPVPLSCFTPNISLKAIPNNPGNLEYKWTAEQGGNIVSGATSATAIINQPGLYKLLITNIKTGCTATNEYEVQPPPPAPIAMASATAITCTQPQAILSGAGSITNPNSIYTWTAMTGTLSSDPKKITATASSAGTYILQVWDLVTGCKAFDTVTVVSSWAKPVLSLAPPGMLQCNQQDTIALNATITPSNALLTWTTSNNGNIVSGNNSVTPQVNAAGAYTLTATNPANGCSSSASVTVVQPVTLLAVVNPPPMLSCTQPSLALNATSSSDGPDIAYTWTTVNGNIQSGANTLTPIVTAPGVYRLLVLDSLSGCSKDMEVTVLEDKSTPELQAIPPLDLNCTTPTTTLSALRLDSLPNVALTWTTTNGSLLVGANTLTPTIGAEGMYTLQAVNSDNGCQSFISLIVNADFNPPTVQAGPAVSLTCTTSVLTLNGSANSANNNLSYQWSGPSLVSGASTLYPQVDQPGIYTLSVTDLDNGCTATANVAIALNQTPPTADAGPAAQLSCSTTILSLQAAATATGAALSYQWAAFNGGNIASGGNTLLPTVDQPGTYVLTVTDLDNGCTASDEVSISEDKTSPIAQAGPDQTITCGKFAINLNGSGSTGGNFTYTWTTLDGNLAAEATSLQPTVDAPGIYTLLVTNTQNGCTATDQVSVLKDANVPISIAQTPGILNCLTPFVQLNAAGSSQGANFIYTWTTVNGNILSGKSTLTPTVDAPGIYTLSVFNSVSQCTATASVTVLENRQIPAAVIKSPPLLTCQTLALTLDASGSAQGNIYTYTWVTSSGGNITSGATGLTPTVNQPGIYALTVTDAQNGCTAAQSVTVLKNTILPTANAGVDSKITCTQTTVSLNGTGSAANGNPIYLWTTSDGNLSLGANTPNPVVDAPGTYNLLVTDAQNGCTASDQVVVQKDANIPTIITQAPGILNCKITSIQLNALGTQQGTDINYLWSSTNGNILSGGNTLTPTVNAPGTYTLQVLNTVSNCAAVASLTVLEDKVPPIAKATAPNPITCKNLSIALQGIGSSTGSNIQYSWTTANGNILSGSNTLMPTVDKSGQYTLLVTNTPNGCTATNTVTVSLDQTAPIAQINPTTQLNCITTAIQLNALGSSNTPNLNYQWTATSGGNILLGDKSLTPTINEPGQYDLLITDPANGCTAQASIAVTRDVQPPIASIAPAAQLNCTVANISLNSAGSSTGNNFAYLWTTSDGNILSGSNTLAPSVDKPGQYTLLISNTTNGCTATVSTSVTQDISLPVVDAGASKTLPCNSSALILTGTATNTGANFDILWTTLDGQILSGANTLSPTISSAGTYTLRVKNLQNGCSQSDGVTVLKDQNAPISIAATSGLLTCKITQLALNGTGSSAGAQYAYSWSTTSGNIVSGSNTLNPVVSKPGVYTLLVTDGANTCTATATVTVLENKTLPPVSATAATALTCKTNQVALAGSSPAQVAYAWSGPGILSGSNTPNPTVQASGIYTLQVTDLDNGCTANTAVQVLEDKTPPIVAIESPTQLNCLILSTQLNATGSSAGSEFAYTWTGTGLTSGATTLLPTVNQPGIYTLNIIHQTNGCTASASTTVTQDVQAPIAHASGGFELNCTVESGLLSSAGSSSGAQYAYAWNGAGILSGANTAAPKVSKAGLYTLTVRNLLNGCQASASVPVTENPNQPTGLKRSFSPPNCKGVPGRIQFEEVLGGAAPYAYSINGGTTFSTAKQFEKLSPGTYLLLVQDANGCEYAESLTLSDPVIPKVSIQPEVKLDFGTKDTLTAILNIPLNEVDTIIWSPMEGLTLTDQPNVVIAQPLRFTKYQVQVINKDGCEDRALLTVRVDKPQLWAPNVFSPKRQDGQNDWFLLFAGEGTVKIIRTLQVFDRWGTMVFQNNDLLPNVEKMGWDGRFRGTTMQPAVFVWYAEVVLENGEEIIMKGDVTIVD